MDARFFHIQSKECPFQFGISGFQALGINVVQNIVVFVVSERNYVLEWIVIPQVKTLMLLFLHFALFYSFLCVWVACFQFVLNFDVRGVFSHFLHIFFLRLWTNASWSFTFGFLRSLHFLSEILNYLKWIINARNWRCVRRLLVLHSKINL